MSVENIKCCNTESNKMVDTKTGIDIVKFIASILVVYLHTYCYDLGIVGDWIKRNVTILGVPFFFIVSGFFFGKGLASMLDSSAYFKKYVFKIIKMYLAWTVLTLPVGLYAISVGHPEYSVFMKFLYWIRHLLFSGSIGAYWYLTALIYDSIIIYYIRKNHSEKFLYTAAGFFAIVGILYNLELLPQILQFTIHAVFGSSRNFLNTGLLYTAIGYYLSTVEIKGNRKFLIPLFVVLLVVEAILNNMIKVSFVHAIVAVVLFLIAYSWNPKISKKQSMLLRKLSTGIYLAHFPFVLIFDLNLKKGTVLDFTVTLAFSVLVFIIINSVLPKKWVELIYGK